MSRRTASFLVGLLLVVSLAIKAPGSLTAREIPNVNIAAHVIDFLKSNGFETEPLDSDLDMFSIAAHSGSCHILVAMLSPQGWHREVIKKLAPQDSNVFFFYNGKVYDDQPVLQTRFDDYWTRLVRSAGGNASQSPLFGIAQSPKCQNRPLAWIALSAKF
jgi:hypothetical protein